MMKKAVLPYTDKELEKMYPKSTKHKAAPDSKVLLDEYTRIAAKGLAIKYGVSESTIRRWLAEARKEVNG